MKIVLIVSSLFLFACSGNSGPNAQEEENVSTSDKQADPAKMDTAYFAGGCFWCVEASFDQIQGVREAISGYAGGEVKNPTYRQVSSGKTEHAETVEVIYNPERITYETLLEIFFTAHDPTQLNRQGPDVGKQYRSAIYYTDKKQQRQAKAMMDQLEEAGKFDDPIVTKLSRLNAFYKAEDYHQDYEEKNPNDRYIQNVSRPKINKVKETFSDLLKNQQD